MGNKFNPPQERVYILDTNVFGLIAEGNPAVLADLTPRPEFEVGPGGLEDGFVMVSGLGPSRSASGAATLRGRLGGRAG